MNAKERYDSLIDDIEKCVQKHNLSTTEMAREVAAAGGYTLTQLNSIMDFLTGYTLRNYVSYRRMMFTYQKIISADVKDFRVENFVAFSGYDNSSSFTKEFSKTFGVSPKAANVSKDSSLYAGPMTWDCIANDHIPAEILPEEQTGLKEQKIFGIDKGAYDKAAKAGELQEFYSFDNIYSEAAFEIAEEWDISLEDAFEYMESWRYYLQEFEQLQVNEEPASDASAEKTDGNDDARKVEELKQECTCAEIIKYLYFECGLSVTAGWRTLGRAGGREEDLMNMDPDHVWTYSQTVDFSFDYFEEAAEYFDRRNEDGAYDSDNFDEYINWICIGTPKETAFARLSPNNLFYDDIDQYFSGMDEELWIMSETDYMDREEEEYGKWSGDRLDKNYLIDDLSDYDEENMWNNDLDDDDDDLYDDSNIFDDDDYD